MACVFGFDFISKWRKNEKWCKNSQNHLSRSIHKLLIVATQRVLLQIPFWLQILKAQSLYFLGGDNHFVWNSLEKVKKLESREKSTFFGVVAKNMNFCTSKVKNASFSISFSESNLIGMHLGACKSTKAWDVCIPTNLCVIKGSAVLVHFLV